MTLPCAAGFVSVNRTITRPPGAEQILQRRLRSIGGWRQRSTPGLAPGIAFSRKRRRCTRNLLQQLPAASTRCRTCAFFGRHPADVRLGKGDDSIDLGMPSGQATMSCVTDLRVLAGMQKTAALATPSLLERLTLLALLFVGPQRAKWEALLQGEAGSVTTSLTIFILQPYVDIWELNCFLLSSNKSALFAWYLRLVLLSISHIWFTFSLFRLRSTAYLHLAIPLIAEWLTSNVFTTCSASASRILRFWRPILARKHPPPSRFVLRMMPLSVNVSGVPVSVVCPRSASPYVTSITAHFLLLRFSTHDIRCVIADPQKHSLVVLPFFHMVFQPSTHSMRYQVIRVLIVVCFTNTVPLATADNGVFLRGRLVIYRCFRASEANPISE